MNSSMNLVQTYQGGIGMGQRDYYLEMTNKLKTSVINIRNILPKCFSWLVMMKLLHRKQ